MTIARTEDGIEVQWTSSSVPVEQLDADNYNDDVQFHLGRMYEDGLGDLEQAIHWYRKAAENGSEPAKAALAILSTTRCYALISLAGRRMGAPNPCSRCRAA
jgi:TPR repeat protein